MSVSGERYRRLKSAGLCVRCKQPSPDRTRCDECREKRRAYRKEGPLSLRVSILEGQLLELRREIEDLKS